jgi:hypothetical protein
MLEIDARTGVQPATFKKAFEQICQGERPWLPLGNMMHQWYGQYQHWREEIVCEPIEISPDATEEQLRWAAWCAASVEYLCNQAGLQTPGWALQDRWTLVMPWYYDDEVETDEEREELRAETPPEFARRNIFCGARPYRNKYENKRSA